MKIILCLFILLNITAYTKAQGNNAGGNPLPTEKLSVQVIDLTPRFIKFYDSALSKKPDPETRWQLWQKMYGFAAVPPGPAGKALARTLLDSAWPKYPNVMIRIRQGAAVVKPSPKYILQDVVKLLQVDTNQYAVKVMLLVFVGGLENNAYTFNMGAIPVVAIPVETEDQKLELTMAHEFTHAVRTKIAVRPAGYRTDVSELVMDEGLAMRVTERLVPGQTPDIYTNARYSTWFKDAQGRQVAILKGIQQHLTDTTSDGKAEFIFGTGTTGLEREAYYAGWVLVGQLEKQGMTLAELARLSPDSEQLLLRKAIEELVREN